MSKTRKPTTISTTECGETFCYCMNCIPDGPVLYTSPEFLALHPETVVIAPFIC